MSAQRMIDYAVRNLTTGDGEQDRIPEFAYDYLRAFDEICGKAYPAQVQNTMRAEVRRLILGPGDWWSSGFDFRAWNDNCDKLILILMPLISEPALYARAYDIWEARILNTAA